MRNARRTTVSASAESLSTLEAEAGRRGVPLTAVVAEAIDEKAVAIRTARRPRFGRGSSGGGSAGAATLASDPVADAPR